MGEPQDKPRRLGFPAEKGYFPRMPKTPSLLAAWRTWLARTLRFAGWGLLALLTGFLIAKGVARRPYLDIEDVVPGLTFDFPVHLTFLGDKLLVTERAGRVVWVRHDSTRVEGEVLNLTGRVYSGGSEEGLLSIALDPAFPEKPFLYAFYSMDPPKRSVVSRFVVGKDLSVDPRSEQIVLQVPKPRDTHNGGLLAFDHQGYLMVSLGDSEASEKIGDKIQSRQTFLGTILRLDVSHSTPSKPYAIPADNPFVGAKDGSLPEIWAYGFRNPWRFSYDRETDSWMVADVGATLKEEVSQVRAGENHGWPLVEGDVCHPRSYGSCDQPGLIKPLASVSHKISVAVTGAALYRGEQVPSLKGRVIFSDYIRGIFSFPYLPGTTQLEVRKDIFKWPTPRGPNVGSLYATASLVVGPDREIYLVNARGTIGKIRELTWWKWLRGFLYEMLSFA